MKMVDFWLKIFTSPLLIVNIMTIFFIPKRFLNYFFCHCISVDDFCIMAHFSFEKIEFHKRKGIVLLQRLQSPMKNSVE